jgi:hypothetical protein
MGGVSSIGKRFTVVAVLSLTGLLSGCGGGEGDGLYPLSGLATFNGEPIDLGSIALIPAGGGGGEQMRASGGVIKDGKYLIPPEKGPTAGTYRVEVHWLKKTGKTLVDEETESLYDERIEALPPEFHRKSDLTIEIPAPENTHDLKLTAG